MPVDTRAHPGQTEGSAKGTQAEQGGDGGAVNAEIGDVVIDEQRDRVRLTR